ncbi:hypothetical protein MNBD_GAMMA25-1841 [hydrothermal vent metagenome]|uniref:Uncharacterized protein n=1 Tax=hydrothermal vent metagenome TaxID=652676 RepID=A0A3B1BJJ8_9ZZZZ
MMLSKILNDRKKLSALLLLVLVVLVLFFAVQRIVQRLSPIPVVSHPHLAVETLTLMPGPFFHTRRYTGSVVAVQRVQVSAQVNARVSNLYFREGAYVKQDHLLVRLDARELVNEVNRLLASEQRLRAELHYWTNQHRRNIKLIKQKMISDSQLEKSLRMQESLKASIKENTEAMKNAKIRLGYTKIMAPFTARIQAVMTEVGEQAAPGKVLFELVSMQKMKAVISVPQADLGQLQVGLMVKLSTPATGLLQQTKIEKIYPALDPATRNATFEAYFTVQHAGDHAPLYPGMVAEALVELQQDEAALLIPHHAVHKNKQGAGVFVYINGVAKWRQVRYGAVDTNTGRVLIISGLKTGEKIIVTPDPRLKDGLDVAEVAANQSEQL